MKRHNPIRFALLAAAALLTHTTFAAKPPPPPPPPQPSSGTLVLDYLYQGVTAAENFGLTVAPSGAIYAAGTAYEDDAASGWRSLVLGSGDDGATWLGPLDDWGSPNFYTEGGIMAADPAGNLYTATIVYDFITPDHWVVRRSTDAGATWATVDDFDQGGSPGDSYRNIYHPTGIAVDAAGNIYVAGM